MKHTYNITGMTCGNCKASVEKALQTIPSIESVDVDLETSEVTITTSKTISTSQLQNALSSKYSISEQNEHHIFESSSEITQKDKTDLQQLFPLFLIFAYITVTAVFLNKNTWYTDTFMLNFMGLFYIVFSFFKFLDLKGFSQSFKMYDPIARSISGYGFIYPFIELILGFLFLMRIQIPLALIVTLIVLGVTSVGVAKTLLNKKAIQCACLGTALKLPMTKATIIENSIMILMAIAMLINTFNS